MANDNRDNRNSDEREEPIIAVPLPLSNTGNGYIPAIMPAEGMVEESNADANRGDHHGRGFAGYDSSDERIDREIDDHLTQHSYIDTTAVAITVKDGEVTLEGSVPDTDQKTYVEEVVAKIEGVTGVNNHLKVKKPQDTLVQNTSGKQ